MVGWVEYVDYEVWFVWCGGGYCVVVCVGDLCVCFVEFVD